MSGRLVLATDLDGTMAHGAESALKELAKAPAPTFAPGLAGDIWDYWVDAAQRTVLFWDVLRKRGNQAIEHYKAAIGHDPQLRAPSLRFRLDVADTPLPN